MIAGESLPAVYCYDKSTVNADDTGLEVLDVLPPRLAPI
jgi:hypothetical protein